MFSLLTVLSTRLELVYIKIIKKIFRKKYIKKKSKSKTKYWIVFKPNSMLTNKNKNSRMGSGVGFLVRFIRKLKPNKKLINFFSYTTHFLNKVKSFYYYKLKIKTYFNN